MYDLNTHFKLSEQIIRDTQRKMNRCLKIAEFAKKYNLKKLNNYYANKGMEMGIASFKLCAANIDLLLFGLDHNLFKKGV